MLRFNITYSPPLRNAENVKLKPCAAPQCLGNADRSAQGKLGLCSKHYQRFKKHGDPTIVKEQPSPAKDWALAHKDHTSDECLIWPFHIGKDGYGRIHYPNGGQLTTAARFMCLLAHGKPPTPKHETAHSCGKGNEGCVNPKHLYWATPTENQADRVTHGTSNRGAQQWNAKLTEEDVLKIRASKKTRAELATHYGVTVSTIKDIILRRRWAWL